MRVIHKFPLSTEDMQYVPMPSGAELLTVQMQRSQITVWALVVPTARKVERNFYVFPTGQKMPDWVSRTDYVGTVQQDNGLVWHVFAGR